MQINTAGKLFFGLVWIQLALSALVIQGGAVGIGLGISVVSVLGALLIVPTLYGALSGAPFLPTEEDRVMRMLEMAGVKPGDAVVDLGAGDGRFVIAAARMGARAEGWEVNPYLWLIGKWKILRAGVGDRATLHLASYWPDDMSHADVVMLFLITGQMKRMQEKLQRELKPGSRVVSYVFSFPDWEPTEVRSEGLRLYHR